MKIWLSDYKTGIECGINKDGEIFLGDDKSGSTVHDTPENREKVIEAFCKYTGRSKPILNADNEPMKLDVSVIEFSR